MSVSSRNVDIVRRIYADFNRTGEPGAFAEVHPDIEWHTAADVPNSGVHRGVAAAAAWIEDWSTSFGGVGADVEELIARGDYVLVVILLRGRMPDSEAETQLRETHVWKFRDGKAVEVREYRTKDLALEAVAQSGASA